MHLIAILQILTIFKCSCIAHLQPSFHCRRLQQQFYKQSSEIIQFRKVWRVVDTSAFCTRQRS